MRPCRPCPSANVEEVVTLRLISWNVCQGGGERITRQVEYLATQNPDVIALQEVFVNTDAEYRVRLHGFGYHYAVSSFDVMPDCREKNGARRYGELALSRWPLTPITADFDIPWPERVLSVNVNSPHVAFDLHVLHVPNGSNHGEIKIETFEGLYEGLSRHVGHPRVLCGDFCTPQLERSDGTVETWAVERRKDGSFAPRKDRDARWDQAERNILLEVAKFDMSDIFRLLNGDGMQGYSMIQKNGETVNYRRYDHIFASQMLHPIACEYLYEVLETQPRLSDHASIQADFDGA